MKRFLSAWLWLSVALGVALPASAQTVSLTKGVPVSNLAASTNSSLNFSVVVPAGASQLSFTLSGGSGDADLYVRRDTAPTSSLYDCASLSGTNSERCAFASPGATTYFVRVFAYKAFSGVTLLTDYTPATTAPTLLQNGATLSNLGAAQGAWLRYRLDVPSGASNLQITTSGGTGALDLYVRRGAEPTSSVYDCRPFVSGNNETCSFAQPGQASYFISLFGYRAFSGASLKVSYSVPTPPPGGGSTWSGFESYYVNAIGKTGSALRVALNEAASRNHRRMSYTEVWEAIKYTDEDPANTNNVILIYTGRSQSKAANASTNSSDQDAWNREHVWPKSHGFPNEPQWAYTDVHHLRPADVSVNSTRGDKDFDLGGTAIAEAPGNLTDIDSFEPRAAVKGDIARMVFYMAIRYEGNDTTGVGNLELVNNVATSGNFLGKLCTLVSWHRQDPVNADELRRHSRIVERQGNRNPFVDYPAWAEQIFAPGCP